MKVDVEKGALRFRKIVGNEYMVVTFNSHFHPLLSYGNIP